MRTPHFAALLAALSLVGSPLGAQEASPSPAAAESPKPAAATAVEATSAPAAGETIEATETDRLREAAGKEVVVVGVLSRTGNASGGAITFLDFQGAGRGGFKGVVYSKSYPAFPEGFEKFIKQKVRLKGRIELYKSTTPQIIVSRPDQIEIVTDK